MFNLFDKSVEDDIKKHAGEEYPKESCGLVIDNKYVRCTNVHEEPESNFQLSTKDHALLASSNVQCVVHSHPDDYFAPSENDMESQRILGIPFGICESTEHGGGNILYFGDSLPIEPLVGRPFIHGVSDCYSIIRDYYKIEYGVTLPTESRDWNWWRNGRCLYDEGFKNAGFEKIPASQAKKGDVILCKIQSKTPNHACIYIDSKTILHHIGSSEAVRMDRISGYDRMALATKYMCYVLRYKG